MLYITHIDHLNLSCFSTLEIEKNGISFATFQKLKSFLHYRKDCLFKKRPVSPIGNLEKWKAVCERLNFNLKPKPSLSYSPTNSLKTKNTHAVTCNHSLTHAIHKQQNSRQRTSARAYNYLVFHNSRQILSEFLGEGCFEYWWGATIKSRTVNEFRKHLSHFLRL